MAGCEDRRHGAAGILRRTFRESALAQKCDHVVTLGGPQSNHARQTAAAAAKLGLGYGHLYLKWFVDVIGPSFTREIFYTARQFDAKEAMEMGLLNRCVPAADLESFTRAYAPILRNGSGNERQQRLELDLGLG